MEYLAKLKRSKEERLRVDFGRVGDRASSHAQSRKESRRESSICFVDVLFANHAERAHPSHYGTGTKSLDSTGQHEDNAAALTPVHLERPTEAPAVSGFEPLQPGS